MLREQRQSTSGQQTIRNVVLVHGAFGDGSNWNYVIPHLLAAGLRVMAVQNPLCSLSADVEATRRILDKQDGATVLAGHSWGGAVITEAGTHPNVAGLVYVAAYMPDAGQSANDTTAPYGYSEGQKQISVDTDKYALLTRKGIQCYVAEGLSAQEQELMFATQALTYAPMFDEKLTTPSWKSKAVAHVIATRDQTLPAALQEANARKAGGDITRVSTCHMALLQAADDVAASILKLCQMTLR